MLRLAEDNRADAPGATPGAFQSRVGLHVCGRRLQFGADAESERQLSWSRMSRRSSVSVLPKTGEKMPYLHALMSLRGNFNRSIKIGLQNSLKKQPFFRSLLVPWQGLARRSPNGSAPISE